VCYMPGVCPEQGQPGTLPAVTHLRRCRFRDPELPLARTDITRFPHAVLEVKLSLPEGTDPPAWVVDLTEDGSMCTEVHKFSKFVHGTCTLFPTLVQVRLSSCAGFGFLLSCVCRW
jgi:hypothetical protein